MRRETMKITAPGSGKKKKNNFYLKVKDENGLKFRKPK